MIRGMNAIVQTLFGSAALVAAAEIALGLALLALPRVGRLGNTLAEACTRAPALDAVVALFTWVPWVLAGIGGGWIAVLGAMLGQIAGMYAWAAMHEWMHPDAARGPRIVKTINRLAGRWRNHAALWVTLVAVPGFWIVRVYEWLAYPWLVWLLGFPKYRQAEWINVSRQKFDGLVGHDLVWCLYCDWMTGVFALGAEMLRNVESFWCPIRFYDGKKCENCRTDFPDIEQGWVPANGTMAQVTAVLEEQYANGDRTWFGHRVRLTVNGVPAEQSPAAQPPVIVGGEGHGRGGNGAQVQSAEQSGSGGGVIDVDTTPAGQQPEDA